MYYGYYDDDDSCEDEGVDYQGYLVEKSKLWFV